GRPVGHRLRAARHQGRRHRDARTWRSARWRTRPPAARAADGGRPPHHPRRADRRAGRALPGMPSRHGEPMRKLIGLTMGPGWRKAIEGAIGGTGGCTHLRELVFNAATAAFQMIPHYRATHGGTKDESE